MHTHLGDQLQRPPQVLLQLQPLRLPHQSLDVVRVVFEHRLKVLERLVDVGLVLACVRVASYAIRSIRHTPYDIRSSQGDFPTA
jgi:hypothetical protein